MGRIDGGVSFRDGRKAWQCQTSGNHRRHSVSATSQWVDIGLSSMFAMGKIIQLPQLVNSAHGANIWSAVVGECSRKPSLSHYR